MAEISIERWADVEGKANAREDLDEIFFEASFTKTFENDDIRTKFHERWLGRYLNHYPQSFYVALAHANNSSAGKAVGYLAGCTDDPRTTELFSDIGYYTAFSSQLDRFPAHLHVNLSPEFRGSGIGARLVDTFVREAANLDCTGVHVVTGAQSRNVTFYHRCGFQSIATLVWKETEVAFLGAKV